MMHQRLVLLALLTLSGRFTIARAYNLNVASARLFVDPFKGSSSRASYFGFSVGLYTSSSDGKDALLLVGAPRANSSRRVTAERRVVEPGAVYKCPIDATRNDRGCDEWQLDSGYQEQQPLLGDNFEPKRDYAWLGANIAVVNGSVPKVAVCAPRWKKSYRPRLADEYWYMSGMCYSAHISSPEAFNRLDVVRRHVPLLTGAGVDMEVIQAGDSNVFYYGMGQAGFSAHLSPDLGDLALGAPGIFHWTGSAMILNERAQRRPFDSAVVLDVVDSWYLEFSDLFGYSMTSGRFYERGRRYYASGAPRGAELRGKVLVYSFPRYSQEPMQLKQIWKGEQQGEYFGASLAACDVNGDQRDDLIVGAPLWSRAEAGDEGRVYAYVSRGQFNFELQRISGEAAWARFGTSVACLGDLDLDGYGDLAVGAPYEDQGRGAVYVFNGGARGGLDRRASQRVAAADLSGAMRGFGASIGQPRDVDGDGYPDLAVGAYLSDQAVLLRAQPVVALDVHLVKNDDFTLLQNSTHFVAAVCARYSGVNVPDTLEIVQYLKIDDYHKRGSASDRKFLNKFPISKTLKIGDTKCTPFKISLRQDNQNVIDPIEIGVEARIDERSCSIGDCPIVNRRASRSSDSLRLAYVLDCGADNVCLSDLKLRAISDLAPGDEYVLGSRDQVRLQLNVENSLEPAYGAQVQLLIPRPVELARIPSECSQRLGPNGSIHVLCNLGNPLRRFKQLNLELDMDSVKSTDKFKDIEIFSTTQNQEYDPSNNNQTLRINFEIDADVALTGQSYEETYSYFQQDFDEDKMKKFTFVHLYEILAFGNTPINQMDFNVSVPITWRGIEFAKVSQIQVYLDERYYDCERTTIERNATEAGSRVGLNPSTVAKEQAKSLFVNCTDGLIGCEDYTCKLGPFETRTSVARIIVKIDVEIAQIANTQTNDDVEAINFASNGHAHITVPSTNVELTDRPKVKYVNTIFSKRSENKSVALWIIVSSVLMGVISLAALTSILYKLGFFNRNRPAQE
ncbi:hypothetical protein TKK_0005947 [Trichogramma kaykai]|uniref:Integrin alpha second immunoglobulin-like domain-containing protein n=1 Tax=Trichogramma kaykai TaxID=54128 RepID=A0ABD2XHH7_9HYME